MDYSLILYILVSIALGVGGTYYIFQVDRALTSFMYLIGVIFVLVYFGLRWFAGDNLRLGGVKSNVWPPVINLCPDFLTLTERGSGTAVEKICVDLIGVASGAGGIQKLTEPTQINNDNFVFKLHENLTGPARRRKLCEECTSKRVTWEGLFDGVVCSELPVPRSDGTADNGQEVC